MHVGRCLPAWLAPGGAYADLKLSLIYEHCACCRAFHICKNLYSMALSTAGSRICGVPHGSVMEPHMAASFKPHFAL